MNHSNRLYTTQIRAIETFLQIDYENQHQENKQKEGIYCRLCRKDNKCKTKNVSMNVK